MNASAANPAAAGSSSLRVRRVDFGNARDRAAVLALLDGYARDPMGGQQALAADAQARLCDDLARWPTAVSFLAWMGDEAVGLCNCFLGYSTFQARPLLNIHDIAVTPAWRRQGVAQALLAAAQHHARQQGCCKITLEVLSNNLPAQRSYRRFGFAPYVLDPAQGQATLMQKWL
ncbi:MAG: GNAT family N-acetyltransferase [Burkholderiaceae bacterium]|jgi:ribosomal protein S18 acetylase RimI-like enzyme|nr:GNAT family N-acetyltransferase [Burkholderiaceae bacterium]